MFYPFSAEAYLLSGLGFINQNVIARDEAISMLYRVVFHRASGCHKRFSIAVRFFVGRLRASFLFVIARRNDVAIS